MKKLLAIITAMLLSCTFIFSQETIKISQIDEVSKGIKFNLLAQFAPNKHQREVQYAIT